MVQTPHKMTRLDDLKALIATKDAGFKVYITDTFIYEFVGVPPNDPFYTHGSKKSHPTEHILEITLALLVMYTELIEPLYELIEKHMLGRAKTREVYFGRNCAQVRVDEIGWIVSGSMRPRAMYELLRWISVAAVNYNYGVWINMGCINKLGMVLDPDFTAPERFRKVNERMLLGFPKLVEPLSDILESLANNKHEEVYSFVVYGVKLEGTLDPKTGFWIRA